MTLERMNRLPYLKRQPRSKPTEHIFCSGTWKLTDEEIAAHMFFEKRPSSVIEPKTDNQHEPSIQKNE